MTNNSISDEPAKLSPLSSGKIDKYEYLTSKVKIACESCKCLQLLGTKQSVIVCKKE